jgi:hypothetical protein
MPTEFWREVVDRVAAEAPDTLLLAEAFWMLEGYFVRTLGMHRVYNSAFMHMLRDEDNAGYRTVVKDTLAFDPEILKRYVNFMNNPDEKTAVEQFGKGDKYFGVATLMATFPGLPMLGHGQVEGFGEKYGMEYRRATLDEQPDPWLVERHEREIFPLLHRRGWFAGADDFLLYDFATDGGVDENVFAFSNGAGPTRSLVVYHNRYASTIGRIRDSVAFAAGGGDGSRRRRRRSLADGLGLAGRPAGDLVAFRDAVGGLEHLRTVGELRDGLSLRLEAYERHVFWEFRDVADPAGVWHRVHDRLAGRGVSSLEAALREQELEPVYEALRAAFAANAGRQEVAAFVRAVADATGTADGPVDEVVDVIMARRAATDALAEAPPDALRPVRAALGDPWHLAVLRGGGLLEPLGRLAPGSPTGPTSRAWFDELRLGPVVAAAIRESGLDEATAWSAVERIRVLLVAPRPSSIRGRSPADRARRLAAAWLETPETRAALHVNRWQDAEWFDRDAWRELADWTLLVDAVDLATGGSPDPEALAAAADLVVGLENAAERAGYRVDALIDGLRPAARSGTGPRAARPARRPRGARRRS